MRNIVTNIKNKDYDSANASLAEAFKLIMEKKLWERRKAVGAKMCEQPMTRAKKLAADVIEEDDGVVGKMVNKAKDWVKDNAASYVGSSLASSAISKASSMLPKIGTKLAGPLGIAADIVLNPTPANAGEEEILKKNREGQKSYANVATKDTKVNEEEILDEARIKIIKARVRKGKVQRRKKVSNVPGYRLQGNKLTRMSPAERRKRKLGAKRAKIKRRSKMSRALVKRQRSLRRRASLGV